LAPGAFATLQRRGPQGRAHIWVVFSCKGGERGEWRGPKGRADALAIVVLWRNDDRAARPVVPSRRAHFWWRLIKNAIFEPLLSGHTVLPREPIRHTVVVCPPSTNSFPAIRITIFSSTYTVPNCSKIIKNDRYGGNMRNQLFDHDFLFDFYSDWGSTAAPSGRSNVRCCGLIPFSGRIFSARNGVV